MNNNLSRVRELKEIKKEPKTNLQILLAIILGVIVVFTTLKVIQKVVYPPEKIVEDFRAAMVNEDVEGVKNVIKVYDKRVEVNDENVKVLINYFKENKDELTSICNSLNNKNLRNKRENPIYLDKETGFSRLLGKHKVIINPIFIKVSSKINNTEIFINDKKQCTINKDETQEFGPLMPSKYDISAKYSTDYIETQDKVTIDRIKKFNDRSNYTMFKDIKKVILYTHLETAEIIVNGKDTGKTVKEINKILSPVNKDTKVQLKMMVDGKEVITDEEVVGDNDYIYFGELKNS
ncbi:TcaA 3rd/4th domain-containing protein [Clostridium chauvoei]|uniref:TcaA 3rd/4th domain-containing protein n=1 Tax=Clostridium chauvoei TaxID=46867 RepID=UPI000BB94D3A|nr:hypothetical protein [Clostridium chauvoei]ATD54804.1 hypothetical protein BTM20_05970 [Clostridium chauvoei]